MLIKTRKKIKTLSLGLALAMPLAFFGSVTFKGANADTTSSNYLRDYSESVSVSNSSFDNISGTDMSGNSLSGWSAIETESNANGMIINVGEKFSSRRSSYVLTNNPGRYGDDDNVLMINARKSITVNNAHAKKGYRSSSITLEPNSYYRLSVAAMASLDGSEAGHFSSYASIYVNGLKDLEGKPIELGYQNINNTSFKAYYFFIATGSTSQTITLDLYLGSQYQDSYGVAFFDEVALERYAQSTFFDSAQDYGYTFGADTLGLDPMADSSSVNTEKPKAKFLVSTLQDDSAKLDMSGYNFDFEEKVENGTDSLGQAWSYVTNSSSGHARVMPVDKYTQPSAFNKTTGYNFVGNDLSFNVSTKKANSQALVLYTDNDEGYVSVKSKDIDIKAHGLYKFSVKAKVPDIKSGNFNILFKENDSIYSKYSINKDNYELKSGTRAGFISNSTNSFENDYTTLTFFVKGHDFYDSSINIFFELGNIDLPSEGCVVIDNIEVEYVDYATYSSASDKLELKAYSTDAELNGFFNLAENEEAKLSYPLKASGWEKTIDKSNESNLESGIIFLKDRATYNAMYAGESFATSYPGNPTGIDSPNNMYMMQNRASSYQSIKSSSYTLAANKYYKLTFDYLTQSYSALKPAKIAVEVVDDNGIVLYYKNGISSKVFANYEVFFHTGLATSSNINVIIHFGESSVRIEEKMLGCVYLDNFKIAESTQAIFDAAKNGVDLTDYYLNLDPNNTIGYNVTSSAAYSFSIDERYSSSQASNVANGGIVSGNKNEFGITKEDHNLLALSTYSASKASLKSNYKLSLESDKYYKLTFDLRTTFTADDEKLKENKEHDCKYGVSVGLSGYNLADKLVSNEEFTSYTVYLHSDSSSSANFVFTLNSDCRDTLGSALLTNINFTEATESDYTSASSSDNFNKTVFTSSRNESEEPSEPEKPSQPVTPTTGNDNTKWLVIPSIIFGVAIIIAIVGYFLRKIKIKKIEKIRKESYDKFDLNRDLVLAKAQEERDNEAANIREQIKAVIDQRELLEEEHKVSVKNAREKSANGKITKETEREFKAYAAKIARLNEKEAILKEQLDTTMSADYLITVEKRLAAEEEKRLKEMERLGSPKRTKTENKDTDDNSKEDK